MTRRITIDAVLAAAALIIFSVEALIPPLVPIPGVKLGLANVITVFALYKLGAKDAFWIMLIRIILGSVFAGTVISFLFSASGAVLCYLVMVLLKRFLSEDHIWLCSVGGAVFHNIGQIIAAVFILKTTAVFAYLPFLLLSGIITGVFTGLCAQLTFKRLKKVKI